MDHDSKDLTIMQLNCNSIRNKSNEIRTIINEEKRKGLLPVLIANDTRLSSCDDFNIENYFCIRKDHHSNTHVARGVAAFIPSKISIKNLEAYNLLPIESLVFEFEHCKRKFKVVTIYTHPGQTIPDGFF